MTADWKPISECPDKQGAYLICSPSADPAKPFWCVGYFVLPEAEWIVIPNIWKPGAKWTPLPEKP